MGNNRIGMEKPIAMQELMRKVGESYYITCSDNIQYKGRKQRDLLSVKYIITYKNVQISRLENDNQPIINYYIALFEPNAIYGFMHL